MAYDIYIQVYLTAGQEFIYKTDTINQSETGNILPVLLDQSETGNILPVLLHQSQTGNILPALFIYTDDRN